MAGTLDELAPMNVGAKALTLSLASPSEPLRAFSAIVINVDYTGAGGAGIVLPLEMTVVGPSSASFARKNFRRVAPSALSFTPKEGGRHLVRLREIGHNKIYGTIEMVVSGDRIGT